MKKLTKLNVKRYDFVKKVKPLKGFFRWLTNFLSTRGLKGVDYSIEKVDMEGLEPPFLVLGTHLSYFDLNMMVKAMKPQKLTYVCAIDAINANGEWLMRNVGVIGKRKFVKDLNLLKNMKYSIDNLKDHNLVLYPEAKFSLDGCTSYLPDTMGKLAKFLKVPVVVANMHGNYVNQPQWNKTVKRTKLHTVVTKVVTKEEVESLSIDEIQSKIQEIFVYDDFAWQKENNVIINDSKRAEGLNGLLYKCAECGIEHDMVSYGTTLECRACKSKWEMTELGELKSHSGVTRFSHIPDWFNFQKECVREEVDSGKYNFEDEVEVYTMPNGKSFYYQGVGKLAHNLDGFSLSCEAYGEHVEEHWKGIETDGLHIEYRFRKIGDAVDISTLNESYWLFPKSKRDCIAKLSLATDEIYRIKKQELKAQQVNNDTVSSTKVNQAIS